MTVCSRNYLSLLLTGQKLLLLIAQKSSLILEDRFGEGREKWLVLQGKMILI